MSRSERCSLLLGAMADTGLPLDARAHRAALEQALRTLLALDTPFSIAAFGARHPDGQSSSIIQVSTEAGAVASLRFNVGLHQISLQALQQACGSLPERP
jgi:hypothetical protein